MFRIQSCSRCLLAAVFVGAWAFISCAAGSVEPPKSNKKLTPSHATVSDGNDPTQGVGDGGSKDGGQQAPRKGGDAWKPPPPASDKFDWIRMKSGEWLKGEIKIMRDGELEFDSDEFDEQEIDWDDVAELRSPRKTNKIVFDENEIAEGTILVRDGSVTVGMKDGQRLHLKRARLQTILPAETSRGAAWSGKLSLGVTARSGNTDQVDTTAHAIVHRRSALTGFTAKYDGNFGRVQGEEVVNSQLAKTNFDYFLTRRLFVTPVWAEYHRDPFQNVEARITLGAGAGYHILDEGDLQWDVSLGGAYRYTEFASVAAGDDNVEESGTGNLATHFETDLTSAVDLTFDYSLSVGIPDQKDSYQYTRLAIEIEITKVLDLDVAVVWDRVFNPHEEADGTVPERDDFRMTIGLGLDF